MERRNFLKHAGLAGIGSTMVNNQLFASGDTSDSESIIEQQHNIPTKGVFEVIVCGGGPAGVAAAIEAGRSGAKTMLIESKGCLGGVWTSGLLTWILDYYFQPGLLREITEKLRKRGASCPIDTSTSSFSFEPEAMKLLLDELCTETGVTIRFHTQVCSTSVKNKRLTHVITESKSGREAWKANIFVDATGDGDLAAQAGCGFDLGDPANNKATQPFSLLGLVSGLNFEEVKEYTRWAGDKNSISKKKLLEAIQKGGFEPSYRLPTLFPITQNLFMIMANHEYGFSALNAEDVTKATLIARKEFWNTINALRNNGGIWKDVKIVSTAEQIGTREGRRIHGLYTVSAEDLIKGTHHQDAIAEVRFGVDVHSIQLDKDHNNVNYNQGIKSKPYTIPLRALIAKDVNGLLLAGRCISGDFIAHSSYRVTGPASTIGQAAGRVAAIAAIENKLPQEIEFNRFNLDNFKQAKSETNT
jgi:hypothetical protein